MCAAATHVSEIPAVVLPVSRFETVWYGHRNQIEQAIHLLQTFCGPDQTIYRIESSLMGISTEGYSTVLATNGARVEVLGCGSAGRGGAQNGRGFGAGRWIFRAALISTCRPGSAVPKNHVSLLVHPAKGRTNNLTNKMRCLVRPACS